MSAFADSQVVYRDLAGPWGSFRLIVDGHDVTRFRGVPAQIGGYQLTEPYSFGPADFAFPQIPTMETPGVGDIAWLRNEAPARLVQVDEAGTRVRTVWRGFVSALQAERESWAIHCDGELSGRLAVRDKHPELMQWTKDVSQLLADAIRTAGMRPSPSRGLDTGIEIKPQGGADSWLSHADRLLSLAQQGGGDQLTIRWASGTTYEQVWKDRATVAGTVFNGAAGVALDVVDDLTERPTAIYGMGRSPEGMLWDNARFPGVVQGDPPAFPGLLEEDDTGQDVRVLQDRLIGAGYLDRDDAADTTTATFDAETTEAVQALQSDAGLSETGVVNEATWNALFDIGVTGYSLRGARFFPLAEVDEARQRNYTATGVYIGRNPNFDPTRVPVDRTVDFGIMRKRRARNWSKRELAKVQTDKSWAGTLVLSTDAVAGEHTHGTTPAALLPRLDVTPGMNLLVRNFDGDTLFHVAGVQVNSDLSVRCAVDTRARDLLTVAQIVERNRASRVHPGRTWLEERRGTAAHQMIPQWTKVAGLVHNEVSLAANEWTVVPIFAGQSGSVHRVRVKVTDSACEFAAAVLAKKVSSTWMRNKVGDPFTGDGWAREKVREQVEDKRVLLAAWGDADQPGGYYPGAKTGEDGEPTGDTVTGKLLDDAGFDYHTFGQPVLWLAIYPTAACKLEPQRVLWAVLEAGM